MDRGTFVIGALFCLFHILFLIRQQLRSLISSPIIAYHRQWYFCELLFVYAGTEDWKRQEEGPICQQR